MVADNKDGATNQSADASNSILIRPFVQDDLETVKDLFTSYYEWLNLDLKFQDYQAEFSNLPGKYASDRGGSLLLAFACLQGQTLEPVGCLAMRRLNITGDIQSSIRNHLETLGVKQSSPVNEATKCCELKRFFVTPSARGIKIGNSLIMATLQEAKKQGYEYAFLDTLVDRMQGACTLYERFGFQQSMPYYQTPLADQTFFYVKRL
ncbi:acyl-CoA N-acyltransferase [Meira miltonrushii]|uniref:Acyl-CoA N-acyltransferase n=1 Tax=Meira miltonrushii TaxID=1280837 RepID=A0A316V569_9BASI|nr:acyl-CoA N-acyltransferase [Meira miltonrushii]PWN32168.1 acyl-CoA N-acyltransferase [Meira miltonrushii]